MTSKLHLLCPQCGSINSVPQDRLGQRPLCGVCRMPVLDGKPVNLNRENFRRYIERNDLPVVVDFWAPWCGPCKMMAPVYEQAAARFVTDIRFAKVNTEDERQLSAQFGIRSIPTLVLFRHGRELGRIAGALGFPQLQAWLQQQLVS